ncbi:hypothetical protein JBE27_54425, partial [Streptomyces albiflaviniger]|nr:hypothetical protein [Streptomyces albiflaviniger]
HARRGRLGALTLRLGLGPTRVLALALSGVGRPATGARRAVGRYGLASYGQAPALLRLGRAAPRLAGAVLCGDEPGRAELGRQRAGLCLVGGGRRQREGGADEPGVPRGLRPTGGWCLGLGPFRRFFGERPPGAAPSGGWDVLRLAAAGVLAPVGLLFLGG